MKIMASDTDKMKLQTTMWCATIPNSIKNINKMKMVFMGNTVKFVPNF